MIIKVGIVDDHQLFIDGIKSILSSAVDIDVVIEANDGIVFLQKIATTKVDIVLSDIRMPRMDGLDLTKHLVKEYPEIKVLILSMFDQPADIKEAIKAGAKGYIPKNIGKEKLIETIRKIVRGNYHFPNKVDAQNETSLDKLTKREQQIIRLIAKGRTSFEISEELHISKLTVDTHRKNMHKKLGIQTSAGLMKYGIDRYLP